MLSANDDTCERHRRHIGIGYYFVFSILQRGTHAGQCEIQLGNAILDGILYGYRLGIRIDSGGAFVICIQESTPQLSVTLVGGFRHLICGGAYGAIYKEHQFCRIGITVDTIDVVERSGCCAYLKLLTCPTDNSGSVRKTEGAWIIVAFYSIIVINITLDSRTEGITACQQVLQCCHECLDVGCRSAYESDAFRTNTDKVQIITLQGRIVCRAPTIGVGYGGHIVCQCLCIFVNLCRITNG